jgi:predicted nucleic acid-binding protein
MGEKSTIYIETSVVSYLTARPHRDLVIATYQQLTIEWWTHSRQDFDLYTSPLVIEEAGRGDPVVASQRLEVLQNLSLLPFTQEIEELAQCFMTGQILPAKATDDALHIAMATVYGMDYLLTWNCRHIANAQLQKQIRLVCQREGYDLPVLCTPMELRGESLC